MSLPQKRSRLFEHVYLSRAIAEVCISNQIKQRYSFLIHHSAVLLFDPLNFKELTIGFPARLLEETGQVNTFKEKSN